MKQTLLCLALINFSIVIVYGAGTDSPCGGDNWVAYEDVKCFKLIKNWATRDQAEEICNQEYFQTDLAAPTLVSIKSTAEQEFLIKFVFNTSDSNNVWIGAKRQLESDTEFVWNDGSIIEGFSNWAKGSPSYETRRGCVEMQSEFSGQLSNMSDLNQHANNGQWKDVSCIKANWVLCQKLQSWSLLHLQKTFLDSRKELQDSLKDVTNQLSDARNQLDNTKNELTTTKNDLTATINELTTTKNELTNTKTELTTTKNDLTTTKNELTNTKTELTTIKNDLTTQLGGVNNKLEVLQKNPIPIGFIYVQLPGQPEPWNLWGSVDWIEITSEYAGLFFRVLGGGSEHFGVIQEENAPRLTGVCTHDMSDNRNYCANLLANGDWSQGVSSGISGKYHWGLKFLVSSGEVRPRNKAVRIWKRTK